MPSQLSLCLPSCSPGFESQAQTSTLLSVLLLNCDCEKDENKKAHIWRELSFLGSAPGFGWKWYLPWQTFQPTFVKKLLFWIRISVSLSRFRFRHNESALLKRRVSIFCFFFLSLSYTLSVTSKKSPNVYKSCPKMISLEKLKILTSLQNMPKNIGDLGKLIVAKGL